MSGKQQQNKDTKEVSRVSANGYASVKNRTNQKQVLQVDGELVELQPYGKIETNLNEKDAKIKFAYWISKNIVQILNK